MTEGQAVQILGFHVRMIRCLKEWSPREDKFYQYFTLVTVFQDRFYPAFHRPFDSFNLPSANL
jgi:hypothetical protein